MKFISGILENRKKLGKAVVGLILVATLAACSAPENATTKDQAQTDQQLQTYQNAQPVPKADWSQYRQTVIDVENAQIHGVTTTTFFFNAGVPNPFKVCPSIGFPVASTAQLTNPQQITWAIRSGYSTTSEVLAQAEANGVFTGDSSGTYVVCVAKDGTKYISYWEGNVDTEGAESHWDKTQGMIVDDGNYSVVAQTQK